jgi:hypothetical protein
MVPVSLVEMIDLGNEILYYYVSIGCIFKKNRKKGQGGFGQAEIENSIRTVSQINLLSIVFVANRAQQLRIGH